MKLSELTSNSTQATIFKNLSEAVVIQKVGSLAAADMKSSGVLASITLAQFILESGFGKSELAQNANNCFGMKRSLSGNTWSGSSWDGQSVYTKKTQEENADGSVETITADFRKYTCVEDSIADHSAYLLGAKNGSKLRYDGIKGNTEYKAVAKIIKAGGYATDSGYVEKLCTLIEKWNLTRYDVIETETEDSTASGVSTNSTVPSNSKASTTTVVSEHPDKLSSGYYRVRKTWTDSKSQLGAYKVLSNAKAKADENPGYYVFDEDGVAFYPEISENDDSSGTDTTTGTKSDTAESAASTKTTGTAADTEISAASATLASSTSSATSTASTANKSSSDNDGNTSVIAYGRLLTAMNIRKSPSTDGELITTYKANAIVQILQKCDSGWLRIKRDSGYAYVSNVGHQYVAIGRELYVVKTGDSLWKIAANKLGNGTKFNEIKKLNGLTSNTIYTNQKLILP